MALLEDKTDEEIVQMTKQGDLDSFGVLVGRYEQKMRRYGQRFFDNREDVKDLVQDVFLKAYVNIRGFDDKRRFSPWLYRIAHNEFINALKKKSWERAFSLVDFDTIFPHPTAKERTDDGIKAEELKTIIDGSLVKLESKYREAVILYYYEDLSYQEIAEALQIPVSTVGIRLRRARAKMKKLIDHK